MKTRLGRRLCQVRSHACPACTHCSRVCGQPVSLKTAYCQTKHKLARDENRVLSVATTKYPFTIGAIDRVAMHIRRGVAHGCRDSLTLIVQVNHIETGDPAAPAGNRDLRKAELDAIYEIKVSIGFGRRCIRSGRHVGLQGLSKSGTISGEEGR